ncbi:MAG: hypothetical protein ACFCD0_22760 [Gemmataceae bacterium]
MIRKPTASGFLTFLVGVIFVFCPQSSHAQGLGETDVSDTQVGYIDSAIPGNQFRFRVDTGYNIRRPARAEFFYAQPGPGTPGLPFPESSANVQELFAYGETLVTDRFSVFCEVPVRFSDPFVNANDGGLGDMNAGFKWAFWNNCDTVTTFQFRTYIPTGEAGEGLGTDHVSLEPALLVYKAFNERLAFEGELRYWIPIGGTDFAGDVIRYGLGVHYDFYPRERIRVTPVLELVGWTVLDGKEGVLFPSGLSEIRDSSGVSILNAKMGFRIGLGERFDLYGGYGRPITGNRWYENIFRFEVRYQF